MAVRRHGRVLGFYVPVRQSDTEELRVALRRRRKAWRIFVARQAFPKRSWSKNSYLTRCRN